MALCAAMDGLLPRFRWRPPPVAEPGDELIAAAESRGISRRLLDVLVTRGIRDPTALAAFLGPPELTLHDPALLPDADAFAARIRAASDAGERVLVFGDFDADGLTGLTIVVLALRRLGIDAEAYVPDRAEEGHGLSLAAVRRAADEGRSMIVTVDCGTSSAAEIAAARAVGVDVLVTDHHRVPPDLPPAAAVVNPQRSDSRYPDRSLAGSGVAFKLAQLVLAGVPGGPEDALALADLAAVGTVADVAPLVGENRSIVRLGIDWLRTSPRPGLAALLARSRLAADRIDTETLAFAVVPRLNAVGRVGDAAVAARLLLADDAAEAARLAEELESANVTRRDLMTAALEEARAAAESGVETSAAGVTVVAGPWPIGIVGLVAGRLADERRRPAVVFSTLADPWRGSARSPGGLDLAAAFAACADLFERFGGHAAAAGCEMRSANYEALRERLTALAGPFVASEPELGLDVVVGPLDVDYRLLRELATLEPTGVGNPLPLVGISDLTVVRVRPANGGHTQLVLKRGYEVLDGICFGRDDLASLVQSGDRLDVVARLTSRTFGGYESIQLEVRDVAPPGTLRDLTARPDVLGDVPAEAATAA